MLCQLPRSLSSVLMEVLMALVELRCYPTGHGSFWLLVGAMGKTKIQSTTLTSDVQSKLIKSKQKAKAAGTMVFFRFFT